MNKNLKGKKMPNVDDLRTSRFITKADVPILVTIKGWEKMDVSMENQPPDMKYVLHFNEHPKPFVLNQTNGQLIAKIAGSADFDDWTGKKIFLYLDDTVMFGGEMKGGVRVRAPKNQAPPPTDDDIGF